MSKKTLHPSVQQFKHFIKKHPLLIKEVRAGNKTWQNLYEEWTILGEKDKVWEKYQDREDTGETTSEEEDNKTDQDEKTQGSQMGDLLTILKSVNLNDIQGHIQNLSGMVASVQGLLQSFHSNSSNSPNGARNQESPSNGQPQGGQNQQGQQPFNFRHF